MGIALLVATALMPGVARAQWSTDAPPPPTEEPTLGDRPRVEVTPLAGYQVGGGVNGEEGEVDFPEGFMYGGMIDVWVRPDAQAEFLYTRQETSIEFDPTGVAPSVDFGDMTVHYFQIGGTADLRPGRTRPYAVATFGATWFQPENDLSDETLLSGTLGAGIRAPLGERVGFRVEGRWLINWIHSSGTIFCGSGGCLVNVSGDVMSQGSVSGGVSIGF
jgi:hypothetical protein